MTTPAGAVAADANATSRQAAPKRGGAADNILTRKYGPLPGWGWSLLAAGGALAYFWWHERKKTAPTTATTATTASSAVSANTGWQNAYNALEEQLQGLQGGSSTPTQPTTAKTAKTAKTATTTATTGKTTKPSTGGKPGAPRDIQVILRSPTLVTVEWKKGGGGFPANYTFQIKPKDKGPHDIGQRTSYNVGGLKPDTHYTAVVGIADGPSASKSFTTPKKK